MGARRARAAPRSAARERLELLHVRHPAVAVAQHAVLDARAVAADEDGRGAGRASATARSGRSPRACRGIRPRPAVQMACMASTRSRMLPWRVAGSVPWLSISGLFQPAPTPNTKRPPERFVAARRSPWPARSGRARSPGRRSCRRSELLGRRGGERQRHERVVRAPVVVVERPAVAGHHPGRDRDVRVLGERTATRSRAASGAARASTAGWTPSPTRKVASADVHQAATSGSMPSREALTSRWRAPNASAKRYAARLRKHAMPSRDALGGHRGHLHLGQPAGHDPAERVQVVVDVDREAVRRRRRARCARRPTRSCARPPTRRRACGRAWCAASTPASASAFTSARSIVRMYSGTLVTCMIG